MRFILALAALLALLAPTAAQQPGYVRVSERVFLVPDRAAAGMRFEMIVNAGAFDEAEGKVRGIAHYLEHLILVGRNAEHSEAAMRMFADGSANGWTNDRATVYLHNVPARPNGYAAEIEKLFGFYAARLRDFSITAADAERERKVVLQEHDQRTQSSPTSLFYREVNQRFFGGHPSGGWIIGTRESIASMTLAEARAFHDAWYAINNVWFVIRADIAREQLKEIADRALAGLPKKALPTSLKNTPPTLSPPAPETFRMQHADVARPLVVVGKMARIAETDYIRQQAVLSLVSAYINSRFDGSAHDRLVETERASADDLGLYLRRVAPGTIVLSLAGSIAAGVELARLESAMQGYIAQFATVGVPSDAHLARLKQRVLDQLKRSMHPPQIHSRLVSWLADGRPPERFEAWAETIASITRDDLAAVAAAFSAPGKQMTSILEPVEGAQ